MDILKHVTDMSKIERTVFFEAIEDSGRDMDLVRYAAAQPEAVFDAFVETIHPYYRQEFIDEAARLRPVSEADLAASETVLLGILNRMNDFMMRQDQVLKDSIRQIALNRDFMKEWLTREKPISDQSKGVQCPPVQRAPAADAVLVPLPKPKPETLLSNDLYAAIENRQSHRKFTADPLSLDELSFLLWSTQGIKKILGSGVATIRTVPSGGARHPFETYLAINHVDGLEPGMYHYLPVEHSLERMFTDPDMVQKMRECGVGQRFVGECAACFIWSCIPYRGEWRYTTAAHKVMLLDAGHVCQNLYLACEAIGCGTCAVGAYSQELVDTYLHLDGTDEFVVYMSPVGKLSR